MIRSENEFDYLKIKLAAPARVLEWSQRPLPNGQFVGEIQKTDTINYKTFKPEMDGLFCERVFGPSKSFECACGKYKELRYKGLICERCGVELIESRVRRHRMGHITFTYPVTHVWYMNCRPNYMALLLEVEQPEKRFTGHWYSDLIFLLHTNKYSQILNYIYTYNKCKEVLTERQNNPNRIKKRNKIVSRLKHNQKVAVKINNYAQSRILRYYNTLDKNFQKKDFYKLFLFLKRKKERKKNYNNDILPKPQFENVTKENFKQVNNLLGDTKTYLQDDRIKRIKLSSLAYFTSDDEIYFYGLHWDLQTYRMCRSFGLTAYPAKPEPKPEGKNLTIPKFLLRAIPNHLIGTALIQQELEKINLEYELIETRKFLTTCSNILKPSATRLVNLKFKWERLRIRKLQDLSIKRIRLLENLIATGSDPTWMILNILPIIPPALRPIIQLDGGRFASSDLNELYRRIIARNNRLLRLLEIDAPQLVIRNEKRMLQEAVDSLIDNGRRGKIGLSSNNRPLKSLSEIIKGKQGRFRQNLLGKRVDFSGRSVIVVGPSLNINQCGLPYPMAIELFEPFIVKELIKQGFVDNIKVGRAMIQRNHLLVKYVLKKILSNHPIFLNRAPTLHRLGVQAFEPTLTKGKAIKLHPLVCSAFNADFDGDQMAVHIPLSLESQAECYLLMLASQNFLSPANGSPTITPSQDMVLGCYYLTTNNIKGLLGSNHYFIDYDDVILAYENNQIDLHSSIWVKYSGDLDVYSDSIVKEIVLTDTSIIQYYNNKQIRKDSKGNILVQYLRTTPGKVIFNYTVQKILNVYN